MKKIAATLFVALLCAAPQSHAASRADELLTQLAASFRAMPGYGVTFEVAADEHATAGRYDVRGEGYYMTLGDAEVFCDGKTRYEVDNRRREITVSGVDPKSRNILDNPVHAFDFLGSQYTPALVSEADSRATVRLTPAAGNASAVAAVTLTVDTSSMRPLSLSYDFDGQRIDIAVRSVTPLATPLKTFDKGKYADYEFIDFR